MKVVRNLTSGAVALVLARPDAIPPEAALAHLSDAERARHERFRFDKDKRLYRTAHALLRRLLAARTDLSPAGHRIVVGEHGCPQLTAEQGGDRLRFNLSHTGGLIAVAVTVDGTPVGVDVEGRAAERVTDDLARHCFAERELRSFLALEQGERVDRFYRLWTLKEAYMKGRELGMYLPLRRFDFGDTAPPISVEVQAQWGDRASWWFWASHPTERHALGLAVRTSRPPRVDVDWFDAKA
ncbi:MAG: 4'-phosphopantetheinyl transferase superfamily protein [Myxococcota bacterium]